MPSDELKKLSENFNQLQEKIKKIAPLNKEIEEICKHISSNLSKNNLTLLPRINRQILYLKKLSLMQFLGNSYNWLYQQFDLKERLQQLKRKLSYHSIPPDFFWSQKINFFTCKIEEEKIYDRMLDALSRSPLEKISNELNSSIVDLRKSITSLAKQKLKSGRLNEVLQCLKQGSVIYQTSSLLYAFLEKHRLHPPQRQRFIAIFCLFLTSMQFALSERTHIFALTFLGNFGAQMLTYYPHVEAVFLRLGRHEIDAAKHYRLLASFIQFGTGISLMMLLSGMNLGFLVWTAFVFLAKILTGLGTQLILRDRELDTIDSAFLNVILINIIDIIFVFMPRYLATPRQPVQDNLNDSDIQKSSRQAEPEPQSAWQYARIVADILGLDPDYVRRKPNEALQLARQLSAKYHPDVCREKDCVENFMTLTKAREWLWKSFLQNPPSADQLTQEVIPNHNH